MEINRTNLTDIKHLITPENIDKISVKSFVRSYEICHEAEGFILRTGYSHSITGHCETLVNLLFLLLDAFGDLIKIEFDKARASEIEIVKHPELVTN